MSELMQANATLMVFIPNLAWLDSMQIPVYTVEAIRQPKALNMYL